MIQNSKNMGDLLLEKLKSLKYPYIREVRGKGLFIAVEFFEDSGKSAWDFCLKLKDLGLLAKPTHNHIIRFSPPLIITENQVNHAFDIIQEGLKSL